MIHAHALTKRFGGKAVLDGVDLEVKRGEVQVVIGPSGAGKSCLVRCLSALEPFDSGTLRVGGLELHGTENTDRPAHDSETLRALRLKVGMVFQQFNLFPHLTVIENIIEAPVHVLRHPVDDARDRARQLLEKVHLQNFSDRYPRDLSGGEQQRIAIARALAMNPECILFDEPTSALDPEMVGEVLAVVRELAKEGMTLLIVTHEMTFAREIADRIVMLDQGRVIETGTPSELFDNPQTERARQFLKRVMNR